MDKSVEAVDRRIRALRCELSKQRSENRKLRRRLMVLTSSRDYWKQEAQSWKWGALR